MLCAQTKEADSAVFKAQGCLPTACQLACRDCDWETQSDLTWLGELLSDRKFEPLLRHGQALGGTKDPAAYAAGAAASRDGLEAVEYAVYTRNAEAG